MSLTSVDNSLWSLLAVELCIYYLRAANTPGIASDVTIMALVRFWNTALCSVLAYRENFLRSLWELASSLSLHIPPKKLLMCNNFQICHFSGELKDCFPQSLLVQCIWGSFNGIWIGLNVMLDQIDRTFRVGTMFILDGHVSFYKILILIILNMDIRYELNCL